MGRMHAECEILSMIAGYRPVDELETVYTPPPAKENPDQPSVNQGEE